MIPFKPVEKNVVKNTLCKWLKHHISLNIIVMPAINMGGIMKRYGFIGTGSMGGMLVRRFVSTGMISSADISASSKTGISARNLAEKTGISVLSSNAKVAEWSDVLFICVKPADVRGVLDEIRTELKDNTVLISIAGSISLASLVGLAGNHLRTVRVIPSVTAEHDAGVSLVVYNEGILPEDKTLILSLFNAIGTAVETSEDYLDQYTDLTSCAPAFIAVMMQEFAGAAVRAGTIEPALAEFLVRETLSGTVRFLESEKISFDTIISRVATKGGITEEGIRVLEAGLPGVFDDVYRATRNKRRVVSEGLNEIILQL